MKVSVEEAINLIVEDIGSLDEKIAANHTKMKEALQVVSKIVSLQSTAIKELVAVISIHEDLLGEKNAEGSKKRAEEAQKRTDKSG